MRIINKWASFTNCACALLINGRAFTKASAEISEKSSGNQKSQRDFTPKLPVLANTSMILPLFVMFVDGSVSGLCLKQAGMMSLDRLHYTTALLCWEQWPVRTAEKQRTRLCTELIAFPRGCIKVPLRVT